MPETQRIKTVIDWIIYNLEIGDPEAAQNAACYFSVMTMIGMFTAEEHKVLEDWLMEVGIENNMNTEFPLMPKLKAIQEALAM